MLSDKIWRQTLHERASPVILVGYWIEQNRRRLTYWSAAYLGDYTISLGGILCLKIQNISTDSSPVTLHNNGSFAWIHRGWFLDTWHLLLLMASCWIFLLYPCRENSSPGRLNFNKLGRNSFNTWRAKWEGGSCEPQQNSDIICSGFGEC